MASATADSIEDRVRRMLPVSTPASERDSVIELCKWLQDLPSTEAHLGLVLRGAEGVRELPRAVALLLERVVEVMARGESVSVVSVPTELTTQQAADMLNVSRQYLARLLDEDRIPSRRIGTHRRVNVDDVLAFKRGRDEKRRKDLRKLTHLSEELGAYDPELKEL